MWYYRHLRWSEQRGQTPAFSLFPSFLYLFIICLEGPCYEQNISKFVDFFNFLFLTCEFHPIIGKKCLLKCGKLSMMVENKNFQLIFDDITTIRDFSKSQILKRFHHYNLWMSSNYWSDFFFNMKRSFMAEHNFLQSLVQWGISLHLLWLMWEQNWIRGWFPPLDSYWPFMHVESKMDLWYIFITICSAGEYGGAWIGWCHYAISGVCLIHRSCLVGSTVVEKISLRDENSLDP